MGVLNILWRNMKWYIKNPAVIVMIVVQPLIWLVLYSTVAGNTLNGVTGNYTAFILPGLLVLVSFASSCSSGMMNYITRANGSFTRIQISPVRRSSIVLGSVLATVAFSFVENLILFVISLFMSVRVTSGFPGLMVMALLIFLMSFFTANITYTLSFHLPNETVYETVMNTIVLPIFFVSTALFPLKNISHGLRTAVLINPFTYIINSIRSLIFESSINWNNLLYVVVLFITLDLIGFMLSMWSLKSDSKQ